MLPVELILLGFLLIAAVAVCATRHLLGSIILFTSYGIVLSVLWILLAAPDLAITEAAVGTGISSVLFFVVLKRIRFMEDEGTLLLNVLDPAPERRMSDNREDRQWRRSRYIYNALSVVVCLGITGVLFYTVSKLPPFGDPGNPANNEVPKKYIEDGLQDTGAVNAVAGMIFDYRGFDTFGESCVLFTAVCSVLLLLQRDGPPDTFDDILREMEEPRQNMILKNMAFLLVAMIMIFGCYVILNGHLGPGGGFSGGAILGAALVLFTNAYSTARARVFINYKIFRRIISSCLIFYALAKGYSFYAGANRIKPVISPGIPGRLFSAGLIPPLNIVVGLVVAFSMYTIYILFSKGEFE
jgi:multicomponent Na+:H+ antiporter subunit B